MRAFLIIDFFDKMSDAFSDFGDILIGVEVNFFLLESADESFSMYCHRKFGPLSKPRL